jgi:hypothetical protein
MGAQNSKGAGPPPSRALVIGCSAVYRRKAIGDGVISDARELASGLRAAGWSQVTLLVEPASGVQAAAAVKTFIDSVNPGEQALVAFFGHNGILHGKNYMAFEGARELAAV